MIWIKKKGQSVKRINIEVWTDNSCSNHIYDDFNENLFTFSSFSIFRVIP